MIRRLISFLAAASLAIGPAYATPAPADLPADVPFPESAHTPVIWMNLSLTRQILCKVGPNWFTGTGFIVAPNTIVTAYHVLKGGEQCHDAASEQPVTMASHDANRDFAVATMGTGPIHSFQRYSCAGFKPGATYINIGYAGGVALVENFLTATSDVTPRNFSVGSDMPAQGGLRELHGDVIRGMSGGPVINLSGEVVGINDATDDDGITFARDLKDTPLCKPPA